MGCPTAAAQNCISANAWESGFKVKLPAPGEDNDDNNDDGSSRGPEAPAAMAHRKSSGIEKSVVSGNMAL